MFDGVTSAPQFLQNLLPSFSGCPHFLQSARSFAGEGGASGVRAGCSAVALSGCTVAGVQSAPQFQQNVLPSFSGCPHFLQNARPFAGGGASGVRAGCPAAALSGCTVAGVQSAPQFLQNLLPSFSGCPHFLQKALPFARE
jgi:hypothetical protein